MQYTRSPNRLLRLLPALVALALTACGGSGSGNGDSDSGSTSFPTVELVDPSPAGGDMFGDNLAVLPNGNVVVSDSNTSVGATNNGAVHQYNATDGTLINTLLGESSQERLGADGITVLSNGNYVVASGNATANGLLQAGSVRLVDGATGLQIGATIAGDLAFDNVGRSGITALSNGNFVVASASDTENGVTNAGAVRLFDGATGAQIGATLAGDDAEDQLGETAVVELSNGNFVVASEFDTVAGVSTAGSVIIVNGSTGAEINRIGGTAIGDELGSNGVKALPGGRFTVASASTGAGQVQLVDATGTVINTVAGAISGLADPVTVLANGNFVFAASSTTTTALRGGAVILVNGTTGVEIARMEGDQADDNLGSSGVYALPNGNYVVTSRADDRNGIVDAGAVVLMNGSTGAQIAAQEGESEDEGLGANPIAVLANSNYVVVSATADVNGVDGAGSVTLRNGSTGQPVGAAITGDDAADLIGSAGITLLPNGNFVVASQAENINGLSSAGSARLVSGSTGAVIAIVAGDNADDQLGEPPPLALSGANFVAPSFFGRTAKLVDGATGNLLGQLEGDDMGSLESVEAALAPDDSFTVIGLERADVNGNSDAGRVFVIRP